MYLTVSDVAKMFQLPESSIYKFVENDEIPHLRLGRLIRFIESDIHAAMVKKVRRPIANLKAS
jgi:excisionase family DNA binding protein